MMNRGDVFMKAKEARRLFVIEQASAGKITVREASERLELSCRQIIRLKQDSFTRGEASLRVVHHLPGCRPYGL